MIRLVRDHIGTIGAVIISTTIGLLGGAFTLTWNESARTAQVANDISGIHSSLNNLSDSLHTSIANLSEKQQTLLDSLKQNYDLQLKDLDRRVTILETNGSTRSDRIEHDLSDMAQRLSRIEGLTVDIHRNTTDPAQK